MLPATAECVVVMETESEKLERVGAIKFTISNTDCSFLCLRLKNCKTFSCTTRNPESEFAVIQLLWWIDWFPVCICQSTQFFQCSKLQVTMLVNCKIGLVGTFVHVVPESVFYEESLYDQCNYMRYVVLHMCMHVYVSFPWSSNWTSSQFVCLVHGWASWDNTFTKQIWYGNMINFH